MTPVEIRVQRYEHIHPLSRRRLTISTRLPSCFGRFKVTWVVHDRRDVIASKRMAGVKQRERSTWMNLLPKITITAGCVSPQNDMTHADNFANPIR